jgi:hypothetical protein
MGNLRLKKESILAARQSLATKIDCPDYSLPSIKIDIKNQELALRRKAPQRLIFDWEGSIDIYNTAWDYYEKFQNQRISQKITARLLRIGDCGDRPIIPICQS